MMNRLQRCLGRIWLARRQSRVKSYLADDTGVAGLVIAMIIMIVAFSSMTVFFGKYTGPIHDLAKLKASRGQENLLEASLTVHFNQFGEVPCPDADQDGDEDACSGGATTSGTLPWSTMGLSKNDAIDSYGTYYTYVVADAAKEFCVSVPNDYDSGADPEYTGETLTFDDLQVVVTTDGATGTYVPFAVISHGENRLGGISGSGNADIADPPAGSDELVNATANPTTVYTGPHDSDTDTYFDDTVWAPSTSDLAKVCAQKTLGGALNADLSEDFAGADGDVDQDKFDTSNGGTEVQQEAGQAVFADATAYMTTAGTNVLNSTERPLYISAEWTPDAGAANAGFSIVTRAEATPSGGVFDPGITFRFFDGTGAAGLNAISIMDNGFNVTGLEPDLATDRDFTMTFGETYLLEVYDNGDEVWMQITQKDLTSNRAYAYATGITGDTTGTRVALVNGTTSESRLDNLVVGRPMLAVDTRGVGYVETNANQNGTTTGSITIEAWIKPRSLPSGANTATLISQWDSSQLNRSAHRLYMSSGGALSLSLGDGTVTTDTETLGVSLGADTWSHVAVTYDDEATYGEITVYINGALENTITGTASSPILSGNAIRTQQEHFIVGANLNGAAGENIFDGMVSDVRLWDDVRTAAEVSEWYDHRLPIVDTDAALDNLIVNWRFDLESGGFSATQVEDRPAALGDDGDFVNGAIWVGALLNTHRPTSNDLCPDGHRVGAFRCDYRDVTVSPHEEIAGELLEGLTTIYLKAWGGGGGARLTAAPSTLVHIGGGGGYAGGLLLNTGEDLTITVGKGGIAGIGANASAANGNGDNSLVEQAGDPMVEGNEGVRGTTGSDGAAGNGAVDSELLTSVAATGVSEAPGCNPASEPCTDPHYTTTGAPTDTPGRAGDGTSAADQVGKPGAVVLLW